MIIDTDKLREIIGNTFANRAEATEKRYPTNDRAAIAEWTRQETQQIQQEVMIEKVEALQRLYFR